MASKEQIQEQAYIDKGAYHRKFTFSPTETRIRYDATLLQLPPDLYGTRCFDFGGGDGMMATMLANRGGDVVVGDSSFLALSYAKKADLLLHCVQMRSVIPLKSDVFGVVTMLETLEHVSDEEEMTALQEAFRVTKPNGKFILSVPSINKEVSKKHYRHYSLPDLRTKIEGVGFKILEEYSLTSYLEGLPYNGRMAKLTRAGIYTFLKVLGRNQINFKLTKTADTNADTYMIVAKKPIV